MDRQAEQAHVAAVADGVVELMRSFHRAKARMLQWAEHDVEWSARMILRCVANEGPMRAGGIADLLQTDPSTVSRQVADLVKGGLLERRADPQDGRASLLVLTTEAERVLADHDRIRLDYFGRMLQDWTEQELAGFAAQLARFNKAYVAADDRWNSDRLNARAEGTGSND